jgi:predicted ATPase
MLAIVSQEHSNDVRSHLEPAVAARILSVDVSTYSFAHDRLQQAVADMTPADRKAQLNLAIGQTLFEQSKTDARLRDEQIYTIANHFNAAPAGAVEARLLIGCNLEACRKAMAANAYALACRYGEAARAKLAENVASQKVAFDVLLELSRARYLTGEFSAASETLDESFRLAQHFEERVLVFAVRKDILASLGESSGYQESVRLGLETLAEVFPHLVESHGDEGVLDAELDELRQLLGSRKAADLLDLPTLEDPQHAALMRLLMDLWEAAYYAGDQMVMALCIVRLVRATLEYGNAPPSAVGYVIYANILLSRGEVQEAFEYGMLSLELNKRFNDRVQLPKVTNLFCNYTNFLVRPFSTNVELYELSTRVGRENGDFLFGLWAAFFVIWSRFLASDSLQGVQTRAQELRDFVEQTNDEKMLRAFQMLQQTIEELVDPARHKYRDSDEEHDVSLVYWKENGFLPGPTWHAILRAQTAYLLGRPKVALDLLTNDQLVLSPEIVMFPLSQLHFYRGVSAAALLRSASQDRRLELERLLNESLENLRELSSNCPANFAYQRHLLEAAQLRTKGELWRASESFEHAISAALEHGPTYARAITYEEAARFWLDEGREEFATS